MGAAVLALWARSANFVRQEFHSALWEKRVLVKTSAMRQTMHVLPSDEYHIYKTAIRRGRLRALMRVMARIGITQKEVDDMNARLLKLLDSDPVPQLELAEKIRPRVGKKIQLWMKLSSSAFRPAIVEGLVCFGPQRGSQATLVRLDRWLPPFPHISEQDAQRIILQKFLRAYGPAGLRDFCKWSGISVQEAKPVWDSLRDSFCEVTIEGAKAFILPEDLAELQAARLTRPVVRLLPVFDPYMLAHADKDHLVHPRFYKRVYRNQGWLSPVILVNGRVAGIWSREQKGKKSSVTIELFEKQPKAIMKEIEAESERLKEFGN